MTLVLSTLTFYPLAANTERGELDIVFSVSESETIALSEHIAHYLEAKGLERAAALRLSQAFVGKDETVFAQRVGTLLAHCSELRHEELIAHLGERALHQSRVSLDVYGDLVSMMTRIKQRALPKKTLETLSHVAKLNQTIYS